MTNQPGNFIVLLGERYIDAKCLHRGPLVTWKPKGYPFGLCLAGIRHHKKQKNVWSSAVNYTINRIHSKETDR